MLSKEVLLNDLRQEYDEAYSRYKENDDDSFYGAVCSTLTKVIELVNQQHEQYEWEPADIVPIGYKYVLLSFENYSVPCVGRYEENSDGTGGAYYIGDDEETCVSHEMFVNGWMKLPECKNEED